MHAGWYLYYMFQLLNYGCPHSCPSVQQSCSNSREPIAHEQSEIAATYTEFQGENVVLLLTVGTQFFARLH